MKQAYQVGFANPVHCDSIATGYIVSSYYFNRSDQMSKHKHIWSSPSI